MKKIILSMLVFIVLLAGCSSNQSEIEKLQAQVKQQAEELAKKDIEITELTQENISLAKQVEDFGSNESISFKGIIEMNVVVLDKQKGTDLYPYYVIVTDTDVDHNSPMLLTIDDQAAYNKIVIGEEYTFEVIAINVIEKENNHIRYSFSINY